MGSICETSPQWQRKTRLSYRRHPSTRKKTNPSHPRWKLENSLIISWLIKMNDPSIVKSYLFLPTAKDAWEVVNNFYSRLEKSSLIYELKTCYGSPNKDVITFYNLMVTFIWKPKSRSEKIMMEFMCFKRVSTKIWMKFVVGF